VLFTGDSGFTLRNGCCFHQLLGFMLFSVHAPPMFISCFVRQLVDKGKCKGVGSRVEAHNSLHVCDLNSFNDIEVYKKPASW
jgi:hypothetical protein